MSAQRMSEPWTDERIGRLRSLVAESLTAAEIAAAMGGITRNAVIGKVHRLNLALHGRPTGGEGGARKGRKPNVVRAARKPPTGAPHRAKSDRGSIANRIAAGTFAAAPKPQPAPKPVHVPYTGPRYGILDDGLKYDMCRAIVEGRGPTTLFCSAPAIDGSSFRFCRAHAAAYLTMPSGRSWTPQQRQRHTLATLRKRAEEAA